MNHIFVDYENIKRIDPAVFEVAGTATFTLLLGPQNRSLDVAVVEKLIAHAAAVELVRLDASGRNAVDFALAYYLGRKVVADPLADFHLISKDTGYDPLIKHLQSRNVRVQRHGDFKALFAAPEPPRSEAASEPAAPEAELLARVVRHLRRNANSRPKRLKTLLSQLASQFLKDRPAEEVEKLIATLIAQNHLHIDEKGAITYRLDTGM